MLKVVVDVSLSAAVNMGFRMNRDCLNSVGDGVW